MAAKWDRSITEVYRRSKPIVMHANAQPRTHTCAGRSITEGQSMGRYRAGASACLAALLGREDEPPLFPYQVDTSLLSLHLPTHRGAGVSVGLADQPACASRVSRHRPRRRPSTSHRFATQSRTARAAATTHAPQADETYPRTSIPYLWGTVLAS